MIRVSAILLLLLAVGCSDSGAPSVDVPSPTADESPTPGAAEDFGSANASAAVERCMDLVSAERYAEALTPCTIAAGEAPDDEEVQMALQTARQNAGDAARGAAAGAANDAANAATGAANDASDAATGAMNDAAGAATGAIDDATQGAAKTIPGN